MEIRLVEVTSWIVIAGEVVTGWIVCEGPAKSTVTGADGLERPGGSVEPICGVDGEVDGFTSRY
jgi:hypothetical protein